MVVVVVVVVVLLVVGGERELGGQELQVCGHTSNIRALYFGSVQSV